MIRVQFASAYPAVLASVVVPLEHLCPPVLVLGALAYSLIQFSYTTFPEVTKRSATSDAYSLDLSLRQFSTIAMALFTSYSFVPGGLSNVSLANTLFLLWASFLTTQLCCPYILCVLDFARKATELAVIARLILERFATRTQCLYSDASYSFGLKKSVLLFQR